MTVDTAQSTGAAAVRAGFEAFARGDVPAFIAMLRPDATWNHRNDDRFAGVHAGVPGIMAFLGESAELSAGTLRVVPTMIAGDADGRVAAVVRLTASRPDGRTIDDQQVLYFELDGDLVRSVDQYIGDPAAIKAFWA
jgi:ketosteroid isomerase-like protein